MGLAAPRLRGTGRAGLDWQVCQTAGGAPNPALPTGRWGAFLAVGNAAGVRAGAALRPARGLPLLHLASLGRVTRASA